MPDNGCQIPDEGREWSAGRSGGWIWNQASGIWNQLLVFIAIFDRPHRTAHNRSMSRFTDWLPEMVRREPAHGLSLSYQVPAGAIPVEVARRVEEALRASHLTGHGDPGAGWLVSLPWQTRVFGLIPRDVDEQVSLRLLQHPDLWELVVYCRPLETHAAHATGVAAVLFIAASAWIASGLVAGVMPALATILAGALLVEVTRQWAFDALERKRRRLVADVGSALWPGKPAQIVEMNTP